MKTIQLVALCGVITLGASSALHAQATPAASARPSHTQVPTMLPGDAPPLSLSQMLRPNDGSGKQPPPNPTPSSPLVLAVDAAQTAVTTCTDTASGVRVGVAVVDAAGVLRVALAADGALPSRIYVAARKALVAVEFKTPTSDVQKQLATDPSSKSRIKPNMVVTPGAVPLIVNGQLLGAIGVSGGTSAQEERCAVAGAAKILDKLK